MGTSSLIYVVIVGLWAAYLVPKLMRRSASEVAEGAGTAVAGPSRVVRRAAASSDGNALADSGAGAGSGATEVLEPVRPRLSRREAAARRRMAARRRRVLVLLLALPLVALGLWALGVLPIAGALAPLALPALYVVLLRRAAVRRARAGAGAAVTGAGAGSGASREDRGAPGDVPEQAVVEQAVAEQVAVEQVAVEQVAVERAAVERAAVEQVAVEPGAVERGAVERVGVERPAPEAGDGSWEPQPITLPTYVSKPKAVRTARAIDLSGAGAWTQVQGFVVGHGGATRSIDLRPQAPTVPAQAAPVEVTAQVPADVAAAVAAEPVPERRRAAGE